MDSSLLPTRLKMVWSKIEDAVDNVRRDLALPGSFKRFPFWGDPPS